MLPSRRSLISFCSLASLNAVSDSLVVLGWSKRGFSLMAVNIRDTVSSRYSSVTVLGMWVLSFRQYHLVFPFAWMRRARDAPHSPHTSSLPIFRNAEGSV